MALDKLPLELVIEIASYLSRRDVINLGLRTHSKQIYTGCIPLLKPIATAGNFETRMIKRFGNEFRKQGWFHVSKQTYKSLELDKKFGPYVDNKHPNLDFLEPFTGDLHWLRPFPPKRHSVLEESWNSVVRRFQTQATELGAQLPEALVIWLTDTGLRSVKPIFHDLDASCAEGDLRKCIPSLQNGDRAYMVTFINKGRDSKYSLYLDTGPEKGHCVLESYYRDEEHERGCLDRGFDEDAMAEFEAFVDETYIAPAWTCHNVHLRSCDFEEWLAGTFIAQCFRTACDGREPFSLPEVAEEYARFNYSKKSLNGGEKARD